ncbi:MAG: flagellar export chaperone FlgN [Lachnospiraceae bacterium]|jgi:flagellar biosynthesis/type III secretory pathway chaperone|nr:flagellar export chaperone FlgN [Lachnospiraceae bacterium]
MIDNYLQILEESLHKKLLVLQQVETENIAQEETLKEGKVSLEDFEASVDRKTALIEELNQLDQGFERLYDRIKEQLLRGRVQYKEQINRLQALVADVTDASVTIQAQEARNKKLVEKAFAGRRSEISNDRIRAKTAMDYYSRLSGPKGGLAPRFMDSRQ